jgi:hypothetical protein
VSDEDGTRWRSFGQGVNDYRAAAQETAHIRVQLLLRELIPPPSCGRAVTYGFTAPPYLPSTDPDADLGIEPPF